MTNKNNNEEWKENIVNSQDMVCFSSGESSYCIPKRLVSFIEKKAENRGKREGLEEAEEIIANYAEEESESAILKRIRKKINQTRKMVASKVKNVQHK